ncbi:hypothetical protein NE237_014483 [Protea cynaroides]|uniref:Small ribosomal subunit protein uS2c n=1 Tax=Protea cynaroides TaxID=273540 RepID=A0A9Q0QQ45_9MAGN|nr:hypothetical protein NE237_014483 [Protea cynaroides]
MLKRQLSHLQAYLGGIQYMTGLPDIVIIVDQQEEYTTLRECVTLGIPTICLIDTNCDLDLADISIPANDDAIASIRLNWTRPLAFVGALCTLAAIFCQSDAWLKCHPNFMNCQNFPAF